MLKNLSYRTRMAVKIALLTIASFAVAVLLVVNVLMRPGSAEEIVCGHPDGHSHTEGCYAAPSLICGEDEHAHDGDCYDEPALECGEDEHAHDEGCYGAPIYECGEDEGHVHGIECFEDGALICGEPEGHAHDEGCFGTPLLICDAGEHAHDEGCLGVQPLICGEAAHAHDETCWGEPALDCEAIALGLHIHDDSCFAVGSSGPQSRNGNIVDGQCGDDVWWSLDLDTGEMVISGSGEM